MRDEGSMKSVQRSARGVSHRILVLVWDCVMEDIICVCEKLNCKIAKIH